MERAPLEEDVSFNYFLSKIYDKIFCCAAAKGERLELPAIDMYTDLYGSNSVESRKFLHLVFPAPLPSTLCSKELCTFAWRRCSLIGARLKSWQNIQVLKEVRKAALKYFDE